jgi:predicted nucleic acid-binding protein
MPSPHRTLIEMTRQLPYPSARLGSPFHLHPCVLDAMALLQDVTRHAIDGHPTLLMETVEVGTIRPFCTTQVKDEVEEHLERICKQRQIDPALAWELWDIGYLPQLWVTSLPPGTVIDPRVEAVRAEDHDDLPTAELALLLAATVLSDDPHLIRSGIAKPNWLSLAIHGRRASRADQQMYYAGISTVGVGRLGVEAIKLAWRYPVVAAGLAGLTALAIAGSRAVDGEPRVTKIRRGVGQAANAVAEGFARTLEAREAEFTALRDASVSLPAPGRVECLAQLMARVPAFPVTAADVARVMPVAEDRANDLSPAPTLVGRPQQRRLGRAKADVA